jgi:tetratricopeptide (TPR) repeat protein
MLNKLERYDEAKGILEEAIANAQARLGPTHVQTIGLIRTLANQHRQRGDFARAEQLLAPMIIALRDTLGNENINTFSAMRSLAGDIAEQGRNDEALILFAQALEYARVTIPASSIDLTRFLDSYGRALTREKRFEEAQAIFTEALAILHQAGLTEEKSKALITDSMIKLYTAWNAQDPNVDREAKLKTLLTNE